MPLDEIPVLLPKQVDVGNICIDQAHPGEGNAPILHTVTYADSQQQLPLPLRVHSPMLSVAKPYVRDGRCYLMLHNLPPATEWQRMLARVDDRVVQHFCRDSESLAQRKLRLLSCNKGRQTRLLVAAEDSLEDVPVFDRNFKRMDPACLLDETLCGAKVAVIAELPHVWSIPSEEEAGGCSWTGTCWRVAQLLVVEPPPSGASFVESMMTPEVDAVHAKENT